jgi:mono/diheme cytochrome c family protein/cytochrome c oxidase subunit IV
VSAPQQGGGHASADHNPIRGYLIIFAILTATTVFEMIPLFGLADLPGWLLIALSAAKFVAVCSFFMHLAGDHPIFSRLFYIPLVMVILTVSVLMTLFGSWTLQYQGADSDETAAQYEGVHEGDCNSWVTSPFTGNVYCSSPWIAYSTAPAYEALQQPAADIPEFAGFDGKTPEEKEAILVKVGEAVYGTNCAACHQANGAGLTGVFPPLVNDPMVAGPAEAHVNVVLKGMNGVAINGVAYAAAMPAWPQLTDQQIAAVITYERKSWGNNASVVEPTQVAALR